MEKKRLSKTSISATALRGNMCPLWYACNMTMHEPSTSPSNANSAEKGAPLLARLPGKLGSNVRERRCYAITRLLIQSGGNFCLHKL